jgi:two-component system sensor histidine kinase TtrS
MCFRYLNFLFLCFISFNTISTVYALSPTVNAEQQQNITKPVINIGVLAFRGDHHATARWQATVDYLNRRIDDKHFVLHTLSLPQMKQEVAEQSLSFILTNPGNYIELEAEYGVSRILTLQSEVGAGSKSTIGSVVVVRQDRQDIQSMNDIVDKSLMAVSKQAFGGFQVAWLEFKKRDINPFEDFSVLTFSGFPMDNIAYAVRDGDVDVGILRVCVLENMIAEGKIKSAELRVLDPQPFENVACQSSTRLYPNWPLAKLRHTSNTLAKRVARVLLQLEEDSLETWVGEYAGWTIPMDYKPVHDLFRELQIGPYQWLAQTSLRQLWEHYWQWIVFFFMALLYGAWHMARVEHLVNVRTQQLSEMNDQLKQEIKERLNAEHETHLRQTELAHVSRISAVGELASGMAHELNQPLSAINSYAQGTTMRLQADEISNAELIDISQHITAQAERAGSIIQRFRSFLRKEDVVCTDVDLNKAITEALELFASEVSKHLINIELQLADRLPPVCAELIQVEQVILNLLRNAAEAMQAIDNNTRQIRITSEYQDNVIRISISDNGPGMTDDVAKYLFDPFFTTKTEGLGLGLSISHSIMEAQRGRLELIEHGNQGVTFTLTWPVYRGKELDEQ